MEKETKERLIDPYLIDLAGREHTAYIIAYSHLDKTIQTFNIARIIGDVRIEDTTYKIPSDFDANQCMSTAWGVDIRGKLRTIKLHFTASAGKIIINTPLHSSQISELQKDESLIVTFKLRLSFSFIHWILAQGDDVKVLEPAILKDLILKINDSVRQMYETDNHGQTSITDRIEGWLLEANM